MEVNYFTILYWFCHTSTWIRHRYTRVPHPEPHSLLPPGTIPLGRLSAPAPSIQNHASNLDWRFVCHFHCFCLLREDIGNVSALIHMASRGRATSRSAGLFWFAVPWISCNSWGRKESDTTELLIWSDLIWISISLRPKSLPCRFSKPRRDFVPAPYQGLFFFRLRRAPPPRPPRPAGPISQKAGRRVWAGGWGLGGASL